MKDSRAHFNNDGMDPDWKPAEPHSPSRSPVRNFYCESDCMSEGKCSVQCGECADEVAGQDFPDDDSGEDTNVEDSYGR